MTHPTLVGVTRVICPWGEGDDLVVGGAATPLRVGVPDLVPTLRESARLRVRGWAAREADAILRELAAAVVAATAR